VTIALVSAAVIFALVNGVNTGAALLAMAIRTDYVSPLLCLVVMVGGVFIAPYVFGTAVATTLAVELVDSNRVAAQAGMLTAVLVAIVVVGVLSMIRVPTSLTLSLVGAIAGFGWAFGENVQWWIVLKVLGMMAIAPMFGGLGAALFTRVIAPLLRSRDAGRFLKGFHALAFAFMSLSYGANDAQKMLAVFAVATGVTAGAVPAIGWQVALCSALFGVGSFVGVGRMSRTLGTGVLLSRPLDVVSAEISTAAAMLVSTSAASSVGLGQALSGSLIGSGLAQGLRRVRWREVSRIVMAWAATLPASLALSATAGWLVSRA